MRSLLLGLVFAGSVSAFAATEGATSCVNTRFLGGHKVVNQNTFVFERGSKDVTVVTRGCDATRADYIMWKTFTNYLCKGDVIQLMNHGGFIAGSCVITAIEQ